MTIAPKRQPDLQTRVATRKQQLISEILEHKKDSLRVGAAAAIDRIKARLLELDHIVKEGVVDGWANLGGRAKRKLEEWIAK
jgi:hypothetical protein